MQSTLKSHHYQRGKAAPKVNILFLTKNPMKINLDSLPLISHTFFEFLLINTSLKLHYKNISTSAQRDSYPPLRLWIRLPFLLVV